MSPTARFLLMWTAWLASTLLYGWLVLVFIFVHTYGAHPEGWTPPGYVRPVVLASVPVYLALCAAFVLLWRRSRRGETGR